MLITIIFAVDPIGVIFAQKPTQNTSAHQRMSLHGIPCVSKYPIIGSIEIVIGILSTKDDSTADPQRIISAVITIFPDTPDTSSSAKNSSTPAASSQPTRIKSELKNKNTESSSFFIYFCGLSCGATMSKITPAQKSATSEVGMFRV